MKENFTLRKFKQYKEHYSNGLAIGADSSLSVIDFQPEHEEKLFNNLKKNSFLGLINIIKTKNRVGDCFGIQLPIPNSTNTDLHERTAEKSYISPPHKFNCEQVNIDSYIRDEKLNALAGYLDKDFIETLDFYLDKQTILGLLMVGFNGEKRADLSDHKAHKLAQDVKQGWLSKIRKNSVDKIITAPKVGNGQQYKNINALIKDALEKIGDPIKNKGDLVAICGRNVIADHPVIIEYNDLDTEKTALLTLSQKLIGGLRAVNAPYFPESSVLITSFDNLSLFVQTGTIRRIFKTVPELDRTENYFSMVIDFIVEDYNACALIENIEFTD